MRRNVGALAPAFLSTLVALVGLSASAWAQPQPAPPPRNPFLADSNYSVVHADSAQTDSVIDAGPSGPARQLAPEEIRHHDLGM